ncbi:unnamed protein product [Rotaria sp. Silwood2]|nr:unnamed protein product [Rotaria sp. Silwood2]
MTSGVDADFDAYYSSISSRLYVIFGSTLTVIGTISAILSCIVFGQNSLRRNPGSIYLIAFNAANLLVILLTLFPVVIANITNIDASLYNVLFCKIEFYLRLVCPILSRHYLVLASIDRVLVTSSNALTRQRSTHRLAYWSIAGVTFITVVFCSHLLVGVNIIQLYPGFNFCHYEAGNYMSFAVYSNLIINGIEPCLLLSMFAILTLKNLHRIHVQPVNTTVTVMTTHRSKDRTLTIILLSEIMSFIISTSPVVTMEMYQQITQYEIKNARREVIERFLMYITFLLTFVHPATSFYLNLTVSKAFRQNTIQLFYKGGRHDITHGSQSQNPRAVTIAVRSTKQ